MHTIGLMSWGPGPESQGTETVAASVSGLIQGQFLLLVELDTIRRRLWTEQIESHTKKFSADSRETLRIEGVSCQVTVSQGDFAITGI